jgi:hypothetical protein
MGSPCILRGSRSSDLIRCSGGTIRSHWRAHGTDGTSRARLAWTVASAIFQVPTLLSDDEWRQVVLPALSAGTRGFFQGRFPRLPAKAVTAVTNLIDGLRVARPVAAFLGSPVSTYDARRAMSHGMVVLTRQNTWGRGYPQITSESA